MIKKLGIIEHQEFVEFTDLLNAHKDKLEADVSNYAKGRSKLWLNHQWDLKDKVFTPGVQDSKIWDICKQWFPEADLGLAAYGSIGITPHRDDSYADFRCVGINLGWIESWYYDGGDPSGGRQENLGNDGRYPEYRWTRDQYRTMPRTYTMGPGTVFEFNCKNPHGCNGPAKDRWGIFLWKVSNKFRDNFNNRIVSEGLAELDNKALDELYSDVGGEG